MLELAGQGLHCKTKVLAKQACALLGSSIRLCGSCRRLSEVPEVLLLVLPCQPHLLNVWVSTQKLKVSVQQLRQRHRLISSMLLQVGCSEGQVRNYLSTLRSSVRTFIQRVQRNAAGKGGTGSQGVPGAPVAASGATAGAAAA